MINYSSIPVGAIIAAVLVLIPLPAHWRARNVATLSLIAWLFIMDVITAVDTIAWHKDAEKRLLVWCDITTKLIIGASSALPATTLCICKHLELVASGRIVRATNDDKRRRMIFDLVMCWGVPMILMALHYVVQGHRFDIIQYIGCQPATYYSVPAVFIVWFPPLLLSTITLIYAAVALCHFFKRRASFARHLQNSNSALSTSRYLRLIAMSIVEMVWGTTLTAIVMYDNISPGLRPWTNWDDVHSNFSRIGQFALVEFTPWYQQQLFTFSWTMPASSLVFFVFFGFGEESIKDYRRLYGWIKIHVLRRKAQKIDLPVSSPVVRSGRRVIVSTIGTIDISTTFGGEKRLSCYAHPDPEDEKDLPLTPAKSDASDTITLTDLDLDELDIPTPLGFAPMTPVTAQSHSRSHSEADSLASEPPTPRAASAVRVPPPAYHGPFGPPSIVPIAASGASSSHQDVGVQLEVKVKTDVTHMV